MAGKNSKGRPETPNEHVSESAALQNKIQELEGAVAFREADLIVVRESVSKAENENFGLRARVTDLERRLAHAENGENRSDQHVVELEDRLAAKEKDLAELLRLNAGLVSTRNNLASEKLHLTSELRQAIAEHRANVQRLEAELASARGSVATLAAAAQGEKTKTHERDALLRKAAAEYSHSQWNKSTGDALRRTIAE